MSILNELFTAFAAYGPYGMLAGLLVIVFFDAIVVPMGPELLAIAIYSTNMDIGWAAIIVLTVVAAQIGGTSFLYLVGKRPNLLPRYIRRVMVGYKSSLLIGDERIVFVNCFVPVLPFLGAFVAVSGWDFKKSIFMVALGGTIKYSFFLGLSSTFHYLFEKGIAQKISLLTVLGLLIISGVYAYRRRKLILPDKGKMDAKPAAGSSASGKPRVVEPVTNVRED